LRHGGIMIIHLQLRLIKSE